MGSSPSREKKFNNQLQVIFKKITEAQEFLEDALETTNRLDFDSLDVYLRLLEDIKRHIDLAYITLEEA